MGHGDGQENTVVENEQPYPSHWATKKPQLNIHWSRPERAPLYFASDISEAYMGTVAVSWPTATPPIKRPMINMAMFTAPACNAHPKHEITDAMNIVLRRPKEFAKSMLMMVPRIAPP